MHVENNTQVIFFMFSGLTELPELQTVLFGIFFLVYIITLVGNAGMILLIRSSPQLHTPMYFFLGNLAFLDICYSSSVTPKFLIDLLREKKIISFAGCFTQLYFYALFVTTEWYLLAMMAYDRYVAICNPLLYSIVMSLKKRIGLVGISYMAGILHALVHTAAASRLSFCGPNMINSFYCDGPPLFALSCSDIHLNDVLMFTFVGLNVAVTTMIIITSYTYVLKTVLRIHGAKNWKKAFSTCSSHLIVFSTFFGCASLMYARPSYRETRQLDNIASVFYVVMTPMLNPLIYSLRNQEVRSAFRKILYGKYRNIVSFLHTHLAP